MIFEDGKDFSFLIQNMQLKHLLESEADCHKVRDDKVVYTTDKQMFQIPINAKLVSNDGPMRVKFTKIQTSCQLTFTNQENDRIVLRSSDTKMAKGCQIVDDGSSLTVNVEPESSCFDLSHKGCYSSSDYKNKIQDLGLIVNQVLSGRNETLFICDDETLYGVRQPSLERDPDDKGIKEQIKSDLVQIAKPSDCKDYLKVVASRSARLILTKKGQLFC